MTTNELLWFSVGIAGFVIFNKLNKKIPEQLSRAGAGLLLFILAIVYLMNLPS